MKVKTKWHFSCPTCVCNAAWEIATHHLLEALEIAVGIVLAGLVLSALKVNL